MELIRGLYNLRKHHAGCVATIGNFDGVHLGHRGIIKQVAGKATTLGLASLVMTFERLPDEYFQGASAPARLCRFREKVHALQELELDRLLCLRFNADMAAMPAETFIEKVLAEKLGVRYLIVGDDFRFGQRRRGDFSMLERAGRELGFEVANTQTFTVEGNRVSSTRIRQALKRGDMALAERLLGRPYRISGRVMHGDKRGRTLGFPTANLAIGRHKSPVHGIFVAEVGGLADEPLPGVASVGTRPTVGGRNFILEVYLFDFDEQIYGRYIDVDLRHWLRDEERFDNLELLCEQMEEDADSARAYFEHRLAS
ncbi:MAG: bifunctional riboflavin kinase/FAD synthetase [Gammaproteobacteria bacterium]